MSRLIDAETFKPICGAKDEAICEEMTADGYCNYLKPCPNKDNIDMRSYMLGYLNGCEDSVKKFNELNKIQFSMPLREPYMKGGAE